MLDSKSSLVIKKNSVSPLNSNQKIFNQLIVKIKALQEKQVFVANQLEVYLQLYNKEYCSDENVLASLHVDFIKSAYICYKTSTAFSKAELKNFKNWIIGEINQFLSDNESFKISTDIKDIFKELNGYSYDERLSQDIEFFQNEIKERFKGLDIDFSGINWNGRRENIMSDIMESLHKATFEKSKAENHGDTSQEAKDHEAQSHENEDYYEYKKNEKHKERPKTKKQLEKELKRQALQDLQQKSIGSIYKQLAKVLHPDLEQDPVQKVEKEELMKKLTVAYKKNDMYTLLTLEMEWINKSMDRLQSQSNEELRMYNALLKEQVEAAEQSIEALIYQPKYLVFAQFYPAGFTGELSTINIVHGNLKKEIVRFQKIVKRIESRDGADRVFKDTIKDYQNSRWNFF